MKLLKDNQEKESLLENAKIKLSIGFTAMFIGGALFGYGLGDRLNKTDDSNNKILSMFDTVTVITRQGQVLNVPDITAISTEENILLLTDSNEQQHEAIEILGYHKPYSPRAVREVDLTAYADNFYHSGVLTEQINQTLDYETMFDPPTQRTTLKDYLSDGLYEVLDSSQIIDSRVTFHTNLYRHLYTIDSFIIESTFTDGELTGTKYKLSEVEDAEWQIDRSNPIDHMLIPKYFVIE